MNKLRFAVLATLCLAGALRVWAQGPIEVTGTVTDSQGALVGQARVLLERVEPAFPPQAPAGNGPSQAAAIEARTDPQGRYRLVAPAQGVWRLEVRGSGLASKTYGPFLLCESEELPMAVLVAEGASPPPEAAAPPGAGSPEAARPGPGSQPEPAAPQAPRGVPGNTVALRGRILDARTGRGLAGVLVAAGPGLPAQATTAEDGRFTLLVPRQVRWQLRARARGYGEARASLSAAAFETGRIPSLALEPTVEVAGSVRGPENLPISGAAVVAVSQASLGPRAFDASDPTSGRAASREDGSFRLGGLRPGATYELRASAPGFLPQALQVLAPAVGTRAPTVRFTVGFAPALQGVVRDERGAAVAGARVLARPGLRPGRKEEKWEEETGEAKGAGVSALSDAQGRFELARSPAAEVDLLIAKPGFAPALRRGLEIPPGRRPQGLGIFVLHAGAALKGVVVGAKGAPVRDAEIFRLRRLPPPEFLDESLSKAKPSCRSGPDGRFEIPDLPSAELQQLAVRAAGFLTAPVRNAQPGSARPIRVELKPAVTLEGRVLDEARQPIAEARLSLTGYIVLPEDPERNELGTSVSRVARTDSEGKFKIDQAPQGEVGLDVSARGFVAQEDLRFQLPRPVAQGELVLVLKRGASIDGRVVTSAGAPVAAARVSVGAASATTDAEGSFRIEGAQPGEQVVEVFHPSYRRLHHPLVLDPGANSLTLELDAGTRVSGQVVDEQGTPHAASLSLRSLDRTDYREIRGAANEEGQFTLQPVVSGRYLLEASLPGGDHGSLQPLEVQSEPIEDVQVVVERGARLRGRILGLTEEELSGVEVVASTAEGAVVPARVDARGRYEARPLLPGDWRIRASLWQGQKEAEARVVVLAGSKELERDVEFRRGVTLSGRVLFDDEPVPDARLSVRGETSGLERWTFTAHDGGFRLEGLERDHYWLGVSQPTRRLTHNATVELQEDLDLEIRLEAATLAGAVTDRDSGAPVRSAILSLSPESGPEFVIAAGAHDDGTFLLLHVPPGSYRLSVKAPGYAVLEKELELQAGEELLDLALPLARAEGATVIVHRTSGDVPPLVYVLALDATGRTVLAETRAPEASGLLALDSLPAGTWQLFLAGQGAGTLRVTIEVPAKPVQILLPTAGALQVRVPELVRSGLPATLRLLSLQGEPLRTLEPGRGLVADWPVRDGKARLEAVPAGTWTVQATSPAGRIWSSVVVTPGSGEVGLSLE